MLSQEALFMQEAMSEQSIKAVDKQLNLEFHRIDALEAKLLEQEARMNQLHDLSEPHSLNMYERYPLRSHQGYYTMFN